MENKDIDICPENVSDAENEDNNVTGISNQNHSNVELMYFKELKDRIEMRVMPQETENAQNNNGTEYSSQENKEQNKKSNKKSSKNVNDAENEDKNVTGISNQNHSNVELMYFKELKDRIEKRVMPQET